MDLSKQEDEKRKTAAFEEQLSQVRNGGLAGVAAFGLTPGEDSCNKMYSPRLAVMAMVDRMTDEHLDKINRLREFRKMVEHGNDRDATLVERAVKTLGGM